MQEPPVIQSPVKQSMDVVTRLIHLGLILFGISSWLTGEMAEDYESMNPWGYNIHTWLGILLLAVLAARLLWGFVGPELVRFRSWMPFSRDQLARTGEDLRSLLTLRLPERLPRQGLAGLVQMFGLLLFAWMAVTGILLYFGITPGREMSGVMELVEELHEVGEGLIPLYLFLHVGAVVLHSIVGEPNWRKMFF